MKCKSSLTKTKTLTKERKIFLKLETTNLYNKRVRPTKNEPQQGISYLERAREGGEREGGVDGRVSRQSY